MAGKRHPMTKEKLAKVAKARYLIVYRGFSQKEVANIIGVSTKTMCLWNNKYQWSSAQDKQALRKGGLKVIIEDFFVFLRNVSGPLSKTVKEQWIKYIQSLEDS